MCGDLISSIFGGGNRTPPPPPIPAAPTTPPPPQMAQTAPLEAPTTPTPAPVSEDETKRKAKVTAKKVQKKTRAAGTTQLATKKPETGGLKGTGTQQGVNTGTGSGSASGGAPTTKK